MTGGIAVVYAEGAAAPTQIGRSLAAMADVHFVVDRSPHVREVMPLLEQYGSVSMLDRALVSGTLPVPVHGIVTFSERMLPATAELAQRLALPYHTPEVVRGLRDKYRQRQLLALAGLGHVRFRRATDATTLREGLDEVGFPAVVKPVDGAGSRDTYIVPTPADVDRLVDGFAMRWAAADRTAPQTLIVEECLVGRDMPAGVGDYVSVESAVIEGRAVHLAVTGKFPLADPFREIGHFWPPHLPTAELAEIRELVTVALAALGVRHGLCHTEIKLTAEGPRIIEVNGRLGGNIAELAQRSAGVDLVALAGGIAIGLPVCPEPIEVEGVFFNYQHPSPRSASKVVAVDNQRSVLDLPGVDGHRLLLNLPADVSSVASTFFDQLRGRAPSLPAALDLIDRVSCALRFTYADAVGQQFVMAGAGLRYSSRPWPSEDERAADGQDGAFGGEVDVLPSQGADLADTGAGGEREVDDVRQVAALPWSRLAGDRSSWSG